jgi:mono/diheme cytochrome c family protein
MLRGVFLLGPVLVALFVTGQSSSVTNSPEHIARGKYLVESVAMCQDCHSPRNEKGEFDPSQWLQGANMECAPLHPMPWAEVATPIAGLPTLSFSEAVKLLATGLMPDGGLLLPPMPQYRFTREDAEAAVAYLKSLEN